MWLDAVLAYLHFTAIFMLFAFLAVETTLLRNRPDTAGVRLLGRVDMLYGISSVLVLATGILRLAYGAKGAQFYLGSWLFYAKVALFVAVGLISIRPTLEFIRWKRAIERDPQWQVSEGERARMRRLLMFQVHLAAMIPVFAVVMARGLGTR